MPRADDFKTLGKVAKKEFSLRGYQIFERPVRQLFDFSAGGSLVVNPSAQHNTAVLAKMALDTRACGTAVELRRSLSLTNGSSLYYNPGCKLVMVVRFREDTSEFVGFTLLMNLREDCLENRHNKAIKDAHLVLPKGGLWLELICAERGHRAANLMFLHCLKYLSTKACILCNPTTTHSKGMFFNRYGFGEFVPGNAALAMLTPPSAHGNLDSYYRMLPAHAETTRMCTRGGVRDRSRTYWDCQ